LPFGGLTEKLVSNNIINQEVSFEKKEWFNISRNAKSFIRDGLEKDPKERMSVHEMLQHPWFTHENSRLSISVLDA